MRYERKYLLDRARCEQIHAELMHTGFSTAYPERSIESLYFDTPGLLCAQLHQADAVHRVKYRLRWYNGVQDVRWWEIKEKRGQFNTKSRRSALAPSLNRGHEPWPGDYGVHGAGLHPMCHVLYRRAYYIHKASGLLATVDNNLAFQAAGSTRHVQADSSVLEFKYALDTQAPVSRIMADLGLQHRGFSKYMVGLKALGII